MSAIHTTKWVIKIISVILALFLTFLGVVFLGRDFIRDPKLSYMPGLLSYIAIIVGLVLQWPKEKQGIIVVYAGVLGTVLCALAFDMRNPTMTIVLAIPTTLLAICKYAEQQISKTP